MDEIDEQILRVLEMLASSPTTADDEVVSALLAGGLERARAEKLAALVPLAFGRVLVTHLAKVTFPTHVILDHVDGERVDLRSEPIYVRALQTATTMMHQGPRRLFEPAAIRSAELDAVNQALNAGVDLEGCTFGEPILLGLTAIQWRGPEG